MDVDTCTYNVVDWVNQPLDANFDGYGTCAELCGRFDWDCLRLEERSDNLCNGHRSNA
jgi:hypothetical protein